MLLVRRLILVFINCFFSSVILHGQQLAFRHLDVNDGLMINVAAHASFDRNGSLWFSTGETINNYDGNNITQYHWRNYPFFPQAECTYFSIDSYNRLWACYPGQLILIDEKRLAQPYYLGDSLKNISVFNCFEIKGMGMIAFTNKGSFFTGDTKKTGNLLNGSTPY